MLSCFVAEPALGANRFYVSANTACIQEAEDAEMCGEGGSVI